MEINIEKAKEEFIKYTEKFNLEDENIERKQQHSLRVMKISEQIATNLKLEKEKIQIATLIGLLHDIGRFKQYTEIGLGDNLEGFDHGNYGAEILFEKGIIRNFIKTDKYDEIIKKSIRNHNKFVIENGLTQEELFFAKLIRDADKIDILYESTCIFYKNNERQVEKSILSEKIYDQFSKETIIKKEKNVKFIDDIVCVIAFIFDIKYKTSYEIIKEKDYINKILNRYNFINLKVSFKDGMVTDYSCDNFEDAKTKQKMQKIKEEANKYIEYKIMEEN